MNLFKTSFIQFIFRVNWGNLGFPFCTKYPEDDFVGAFRRGVSNSAPEMEDHTLTEFSFRFSNQSEGLDKVDTPLPIYINRLKKKNVFNFED